MQVCRICLAASGRLLSIRKYCLEEAYHHLTGLACEDRLPQQLCVECAQRLVSSSKLRNKSLRAHSIMTEIVRRQDNLTLEHLATINRVNNRLTSDLEPKYFEPNFYNLTLDHDTIDDEKEILTDGIVIKSANVDFSDQVKEENDFEENNDVDNDVDFVASDKEYLTDDSLPLEARRKKKIEKKEVIKKDSVHHLKSIDRQKHNLISTLVCKTYVNPNDLELQETELTVRKRTEPIQEININEVSTDNDIDIDNNFHFESDAEKLSDETLAKKKPKKIKKKKKEPKVDRRIKPVSEVLKAFFSITDLTFEEQIEMTRKRKETANYKNSVFKCADCFKGFLDEDAYNSHIYRHTDQCGTFVCEVCKTHFKQQHSLRKHVASHVQQFSCKRCSYVTTRRLQAKLHVKWHNGTRYQCPHCDKDFVKFSSYMGHIRRTHPSDWVCALCGYSFVSEKGLQQHKVLKHRAYQPPVDDNGPYCQRCDVRFASQAALDQHIKLSPRHDADRKENVGQKRARRSASECERDGRTRRSKVDKPEGPIPCEQCDMQLPDALSYFRHFRRTHPDKNRTTYPSARPNIMCEVCGKLFQSLALLQDHSFTHTDARPFKCQQCDKSFQRHYRLIAHKRLHSTRPQHACPTCGKRFSSTSNRTRHMARHTGVRPFKCEMCDKCFINGSEKRAHITYVHLKKPWPKRARGKRRDSRQVPQEPEPLSCD